MVRPIRAQLGSLQMPARLTRHVVEQILQCGRGYLGHLDRPADALEVVRHVEGQHHVLLQQPLALRQACYVIPADARTGVYQVPSCNTQRAQIDIVENTGAAHSSTQHRSDVRLH